MSFSEWTDIFGMARFFTINTIDLRTMNPHVIMGCGVSTYVAVSVAVSLAV